jgi:hypothetical protein
MATYIFAIGGSGARVLRSLTMLLASGCHNTSIKNEIVANVIDYDTTNGDTERAQDLMELYHDIHMKAYKTEDTVTDNGTQQPVMEHFFCTPLRMLREMCANDPANLAQFDPNAKYNLSLSAGETHTTFAEYINYNALGVGTGNLETRQLLDSLYATDPEFIPGTTQDNPKAELKMNFHKGFRGCPNLGCIVTKQLEGSPELRLAIKTLIQPTDRIIIIGSVFGGTGASGIPMLLDMISNAPNAKAAKKAVIAVMPYFSVGQDNNSAIDSNTFIAKAKAAIGAYEGTINGQADCFYYVGDAPKNSFANHDGDREQKNDAHYVELVSAMCVMDFITQEGTKGFECFLDNWQEEKLEINAFFKDELQQPYIYPLARFKLFSTFCKNNLFKSAHNANDIWFNGIAYAQKNCKAIGDPSCNAYRDNIKKFIDKFDEWIKELSDNQSHRPLILFNDTLDYKDVWKYSRIEVKKSLFPLRLGWELQDSDFCQPMTDSFNQLNPKLGQGIADRPEYLFWRGAKYTMDKIGETLKNKHINFLIS